MREELIPIVGAQHLDTSSYQLTGLEDIALNWENSQLDMDAIFRPGIDTLFSPTTFDDLSMEGSVENPIVVDEEEDKEISAPTTTTPLSERPPEPPFPPSPPPSPLPPFPPPPITEKSCFWSKIGNVPEYVYRNLFQYLLPGVCFDIIYN